MRLVLGLPEALLCWKRVRGSPDAGSASPSPHHTSAIAQKNFKDTCQGRNLRTDARKNLSGMLRSAATNIARAVKSVPKVPAPSEKQRMGSPIEGLLHTIHLCQAMHDHVPSRRG